jgi:YidC/Oxa1 family membrane protein insertase
VAQIKLKEKEGELASIKEKYKDKQEQALKVMEFYRNNGINPLSSILTAIIQIPVVFSLYYIFFKSGLPTIDQSLLYSFVKPPANISMMFLGFFDISKKSLIFALLAASSTFFQMHFSTNQNSSNNQSSSAEDFSKMLAKQMKYTMPLVVFFVSWRISAVVALYWFVSNILGIFQDFYIKKTLINNSK